jgi:hypothetical protein
MIQRELITAEAAYYGGNAQIGFAGAHADAF